MARRRNGGRRGQPRAFKRKTPPAGVLATRVLEAGDIGIAPYDLRAHAVQPQSAAERAPAPVVARGVSALSVGDVLSAGVLFVVVMTAAFVGAYFWGYLLRLL